MAVVEPGFKTSWVAGQVVFRTKGAVCQTAADLLRSELFARLIRDFIASLRRRDSPLLGVLQAVGSEGTLIGLLDDLARAPLSQVAGRWAGAESLLERCELLLEFVEALYNYWRELDRFLICLSESSEGALGHDARPYRTFNNTVEHLNHLARATYRDICENVCGDHPRVYRQVPAGFQVGLIAVPSSTPLFERAPYGALASVPLIRQVLMDPPLIIDPPTNYRTGQFQRVEENPLQNVELDPGEWLCYPAKVGPLVIFIYFHQRFIGLGCSLANLFELASDEEVRRSPDAVYAYGVRPESLARFGNFPTVFHDDEANGCLVAAVPGQDRFGYFGYLKKMVLTLHNVAMMKRGRLPFHGAMVRVESRNGIAGTVVLIGDTAAGKSESLEAFRVIGDEFIREMRIVADDMGSFDVDSSGRLRGYGTEIGAFVRLDDLQPGFAFGELDRTIIMSPQKVNARAVLPVTTMSTVLHGYPVDYLLYANNYEEVDADHPVIERFENVDEALHVFREGAAMAKGTTSATGLTHSYFANIFGPPQYRDLHEKLARRYFEAAFAAGVFVGQLRTRLGIPGCETRGPAAAARALLDLIAWGQNSQQ